MPISPDGILVVFILLGIFLLIARLVWQGVSGQRRFTIQRAMVIIALVAVGLQVPIWLQPPRHRHSRKQVSASNLRQLGLGLLAYGNIHNQFPPGSTYDPLGVPLHGWPSLILPYVDNVNLANATNFSRPWDDPTPGADGGPSNQTITSESIVIYRMPGAGLGPNQPTLCYATNAWVIGGPTPRRLRTITDGLAQTILAGEAAGNFRPWGSPNHARDPNLGINRSPSGFGSPFPGGANFVFADGSVRFLRNETSIPVFRALATPDGDERIDRADLDDGN